MSATVFFQTAIEYVEALSTEDQELLFELIKKRRSQRRRTEIAKNAAETLAAWKAGTTKRNTLAQLQADLLESE